MTFEEFVEAVRERAAGEYCRAIRSVGMNGASDHWVAYVNGHAYTENAATPEAALKQLDAMIDPEPSQLAARRAKLESELAEINAKLAKSGGTQSDPTSELNPELLGQFDALKTALSKPGQWCSQCSEHFTSEPARLSGSPAMFCSPDCAMAYGEELDGVANA